eukprot:2977328-Pyramimonas_sp.AAC.1
MRYELCAMNFALCAMNYALCVSDSRRRGRGRHRGHATILMTDQSDAWIMGIFSRRANRTQEDSKKRTREAEHEAYRWCKTARQTGVIRAKGRAVGESGELDTG